MFKIGTVIQYFEKTSIAFVKLENIISVGEKVKFVNGNKDLFDQTIEYIQKGYDKLDSADRGDLIGIKTNKPVNKGVEIFKLSAF